MKRINKFKGATRIETHILPTNTWLMDRMNDYLNSHAVVRKAHSMKDYKTEYEYASYALHRETEENAQLKARIEGLQDFAIWMTGCGYDFCQHEYFIKQRDNLLLNMHPEDSTEVEAPEIPDLIGTMPALDKALNIRGGK